MICQVALPPDLEEAFFIRRLNRFAAEVTVRGSRELAHVPSSGRMAELLVPGRRVWVSRHRRSHCRDGLPKGGQAGTRKTACRLMLAEHRQYTAPANCLFGNFFPLELFHRFAV